MSIEAMKQEHSKRHNCPHCEREFACNHHQWLGLTDEDVGVLKRDYQSGEIGSFVALTSAIEAKLKEKNT
jgi:hypothetical protein